MPKGWCWTTIGEVSSSILYGVSESAKEFGAFRLLRITDIQDNKVDWSTVPYTDFDKDKALNYLLQNGDILFARTGATVGKSYLVSNLAEESIYASYLIRVQTSHLIFPEYIKRFFESGYYWEQISMNSVGIGQPNVNGTTLANLNIPIPPYKEQVRIVEEANSWLLIADKLDDNTGHIGKAIESAKAKILDLAIHGKLVPQDPKDEPASELLKRINPKAIISCDNPHYLDLPNGWIWCNLENVIELYDSYRNPINGLERQNRKSGKTIESLYPYYGATGLVDYIDSYLLDGQYILLGEDGAPFLDVSANKAFIVQGKFWVNNHAHVLKPLIFTEYLVHVLNSFDYGDYVKGSTRLKLTQKDMLRIPIPIPPYNEQLRIVSKVNDLFSWLDMIEKSLQE